MVSLIPASRVKGALYSGVDRQTILSVYSAILGRPRRSGFSEQCAKSPTSSATPYPVALSPYAYTKRKHLIISALQIIPGTAADKLDKLGLSSGARSQLTALKMNVFGHATCATFENCLAEYFCRAPFQARATSELTTWTGEAMSMCSQTPGQSKPK